MKIFISILLFTLFCTGCSRGKFYVSDVFRKGSVDNIKILKLDSTYQFYLREVYKSQNQQLENVLKTNVEKSDTANKTRIEVEYLLLSRVYKNAIYISTIPDRYQHYYSNNMVADTLINAYDFNTFHFGKIADDGESIYFSTAKGERAISWDIRPFINDQFPRKMFIREIAIKRNEIMDNVILINSALEEPLVFTKQKNFTIIFESANNKADTCEGIAGLCKLSDQNMYFLPIKKGYDLLFRFDRNIPNSKDSAIRFNYSKIRYNQL